MNIWELQASDNIDALLSEEFSDSIGRDAVQGYNTDKQSRSEWEKRTENGVKLAVQIVENKNWPWEVSSNVKFPLVTIAALQFNARAYPALVKAPNIVKYRVTGADKDGQKAARAARISKHMSYQLTEEDENWEEDSDKMFVVLPIVGTAFKKTFFDSEAGHNVSKLVLPQNLIVNYYAKTIEDCERKTEFFNLSERKIRGRVLKRLFSDKELHQAITPPEKKVSDDRQGLVEPSQDNLRDRPLLEQHCYLDLDEDGYPEPYVVTVDQSSGKVLRIVSRFGDIETEQSVEIDKLTDQLKLLNIQIQAVMASVPPPQQGQEITQEALQAAQQAEQRVLQLQGQQQKIAEQIEKLEASNKKNPKILEIRTEEHYTKYGFIPSPDGGFYDLGLGSLLGPLNDSVNTLINQLIDSGTLNNGSHGFLGRGARIQGGKVEFKEPFEWLRVNSTGQSLKDSIVPLPINQPSPVLFNLLSLLINYSEKVSSVTETMTGGNPGQNTPAYNMSAMLEQGLQVFNAIFKREYRSFRRELRKNYLLNRKYLNPIDYFETLDGPAQVLQNDYSADPKDCIPATDPNAFSDTEGLTKVTFLAERAKMVPGYNPVSVERRMLEAMDIPDVQEVYPLDDQGNPAIKPPKNPEIELKIAEEQRRTLEAQSRMEKDKALAQSKMDVDESVVILNQQKAGAIDDKTAIDKFNAVTERMKARMQGLQVAFDSSERLNERDRKDKSGTDN